jgi:hypothetical protein
VIRREAGALLIKKTAFPNFAIGSAALKLSSSVGYL